jgi:hypothetical protein
MQYSPRNIRVAYSHAGLTHFGGVYFFQEFLRVLQLRNFLARYLAYPRRNNRYQSSQMIIALMYPIVLGPRPHRDRIIAPFEWHLSASDGPARLSRGTNLTAILAERPCSSPRAITPCQ